jgi:hypothetical protein
LVYNRREVKKLLFLPEIEPRFSSRPTSNLVFILAELFRLSYIAVDKLCVKYILSIINEQSGMAELRRKRLETMSTLYLGLRKEAFLSLCPERD